MERLEKLHGHLGRLARLKSSWPACKSLLYGIHIPAGDSPYGQEIHSCDRYKSGGGGSPIPIASSVTS